MKRLLLVVWMSICFVVGAFIVLDSPFWLRDCFRSESNLFDIIGYLSVPCIVGFLAFFEFNRVRKLIKKKEDPMTKLDLDSDK